MCYSSVIYIIRDSGTNETNKTNTRARIFSLRTTSRAVRRDTGEGMAVEVAARELLLEIFELLLLFYFFKFLTDSI